MKNTKIIRGREFEKELRVNASATEKQFRRLLNAVKKKYELKFKVNFQKGWYKDEAFFISDFYFPEALMTIELDGTSHLSLKQQKQDARKAAYLLTQKVKTIRIKNQEVWGMDVEKLFRFLSRNRVIN